MEGFVDRGGVTRYPGKLGPNMVKDATPPASRPRKRKRIPMVWWKALEPTYKALAVILSAMATGMALTAWLIGAQTSENAEAILFETETNAEAHLGINLRIDSLEGAVGKFGTDLRLVRCWALHEIQNTDASECLFLVGGANGGTR